MNTPPLPLELRLDPQAFSTLRQFHIYDFEPTVTAIACNWLDRWTRNPPPRPTPDDPDTFAWVRRHLRIDDAMSLWLQLHGEPATVLKRRMRGYRDVFPDWVLTTADLASAIVNAEGRYYATLTQYTYENPPPATPWRGPWHGSRPTH